MTVVDDHLARFDPDQRAALEATVDVIRRALPGAVEVLSYGMPTFKAGDESGPAIVGVDGFRAHNSLFPYSGSILATFATELAGYPQTKGSIHVARDRPFPAPLLRRILRARIDEINDTYPRRGGQFRTYYDNGHLKVSGRMRGDAKAGTWQWYRRDGSLLRSATFDPASRPRPT